MPAGRPTDYKEEYNDLAFKFSLLGATDKQMAGYFDVCEATLNNWKLDYPIFLESIKNGKGKADAEIAHALYHRAKGYKHPDVHISNFRGEITVTDIDKHYPPDTAAAFIWLKNRAGWRDCRDSTITFDNAEEYFKAIADSIAQSDTNPGPVL